MKTTKIFNRLAILRKESGLSRKELAEKIDVNYQTIGYLEREEYNPSLDLAFRISAVFNLPVEVIFSPKPFKSIIKELAELQTQKKEKL